MGAPGAVGVSLVPTEPSHVLDAVGVARRDALDAFTRSGYHRGVMVKYRGRMAGSHFHTWTDGGTTTTRPEWDDAIHRYYASLEIS